MLRSVDLVLTMGVLVGKFLAHLDQNRVNRRDGNIGEDQF